MKNISKLVGVFLVLPTTGWSFERQLETKNIKIVKSNTTESTLQSGWNGTFPSEVNDSFSEKILAKLREHLQERNITIVFRIEDMVSSPLKLDRLDGMNRFSFRMNTEKEGAEGGEREGHAPKEKEPKEKEQRECGIEISHESDKSAEGRAGNRFVDGETGARDREKTKVKVKGPCEEAARAAGALLDKIRGENLDNRGESNKTKVIITIPKPSNNSFGNRLDSSFDQWKTL